MPVLGGVGRKDYIRNKGLSQRKEILALQKDLSVALKQELS